MKKTSLRIVLAFAAMCCNTFNLLAGIGTPIDRTSWNVQASSWCYDNGIIGRPIDIIDGSADTYWHSNWRGEQGEGQGGFLPEYLEIDLGKTETIGGFGYLPRPFFGEPRNGALLDYKLYVSNTPFNVSGEKRPNITATPVANGSLKGRYSTMATEIKAALSQSVSGRYVLLEFVSSGGNQPDMFGSCAELYLYAYNAGGDLPGNDTPGGEDTPEEEPIFEGETGPVSALVINEIMVANVDMFLDPSKNYGGFVEFYNPTDKPIDLGQMYVSKDANNLKQFRFLRRQGVVPARGFKNVWFDYYEASPLQVNFKLDYEGGTIYFSDKEGNLVVQQTYPQAITRTSYARKTDGGSEWGMTAYPTPAATNATAKEFASQRLPAPTVEAQDEFFTSVMAINVPIPEGCTLRYTTDGSTPTETNGMTSTTGSFTATTTTCYRFRFFRAGYLPSAVETRTFIQKDKEFPLNVVSVVTENGNLFSDTYGCYVKGTSGIPGRGQSTDCNWNMEWERPVNFEYFTADGKRVFNQEVDFSMSGGWSRAYTPHSFKLKASKQNEGKNSLDYPFYAEKPHLKHKSILLRNGGNDNTFRMKDATLQRIVTTSGLDIEAQSYLPVMHYINGRYIGLINLREPNNKHYAYANYGYDDDEIDQFEIGPDSCYTQMCGTEEAYNRWYELSANAADAATYEQIAQLVDIDEYINYLAIETFLGAGDWPRNNIKGFRKRDGGKFRFVLFDLDGTLSHTDPFNNFERLERGYGDFIFSLGTRLPFHNKFVTIFLNMLRNEKFRKQFIDTYCMMGGSVFHPDRARPIIQQVADQINPVLAYEGITYNETAYKLLNAMTTSRTNTMLNALRYYPAFNLYETQPQQCRIAGSTPQGKIFINNLPVPTNRFDGQLFGPIQLRAATPVGYRFVGWRSANGGGSTNEMQILERGSEWSYYDQGSLDNENWYAENYGAGTWSVGQAPFGFSNNAGVQGQFKTTLNYGNDPQNKRPTYYFRKSITLEKAPDANQDFTLNFSVDDGCVVYVNGQEAGRNNMPSGTVSYNTYSSAYAGTQPNDGNIVIKGRFFKKGQNIIAVEVHNSSASSTDLYWDANLSSAQAGTSTSQASIVSTDSIYNLPATGDYELTAVFEPIPAAEQENLAPIRINEVSAANSVFVNEYYKRNDWLELYNTTDQDIDLAGMYLTDNLGNPQKYQIPAATAGVSTIIPAKGYKVIWCDRMNNNTQLHANFKLAAEGGDVMISARDLSWNNVLTYTAMTGDATIGRYPDGAATVYTMNKPSFNATNIFTSYLTAVEQKTPIINSIAQLPTAGNTLELVAYDSELAVFSNESQSVNVRIYDIAGKHITDEQRTLQGGTASIALHLPAGCYVVVATDNQGNTANLKLIVR